ncbi:MAG: exopolysaccharide biosynthesis polyprenyl glycosylphosphotransferase [Candidatus Hydrogenedens sp.]|nr:exopolysaccharide biosynthesis polyprenyl glycosylphosphotransferase [Candidatus Hydrogenedens sp.]
MPKLARHNEFVTLFMLTMDVICIAGAIIFCLYLLDGVSTWREVSEVVNRNALNFMLIFVMWFLVGTTQGMFVSHRNDPLIYQLYLTLRSVFSTMVLTYVLVSFASGAPPDIWFVLLLALVVFVALSTFRVVLTMVLWALRQQGFNIRHVIIVGSNPRTAELVRLLDEHGQYGYKIVGVVEDEPERLKYLAPYKLEYLGPFKELDNVLGYQVIDEVIVGLPVRSHYETIQGIADLCLGVGVTIRMVADLFPLKLANSRIHQFEGVPMLSLTTVSENYVQLTIKRTLDVIGSSMLLLLLSPLMIATAIAIKVTSPGPIFFFQERVGLNQRKFYMIKFRSMVSDAEKRRDDLLHLNEADGPIFKIKSDPRITPVGRIIRKYSIDELPQLINVFKGEMSLVGPRPHPTKEVESYTWHHRRRLSVKPGMTGLAQVSGRSDLNWDQAVELDLSYIDGWSVFNDIWILFRTFRAVLAAEGAN